MRDRGELTASGRISQSPNPSLPLRPRLTAFDGPCCSLPREDGPPEIGAARALAQRPGPELDSCLQAVPPKSHKKEAISGPCRRTTTGAVPRFAALYLSIWQLLHLDLRGGDFKWDRRDNVTLGTRPLLGWDDVPPSLPCPNSVPCRFRPPPQLVFPSDGGD